MNCACARQATSDTPPTMLPTSDGTRKPPRYAPTERCAVITMYIVSTEPATTWLNCATPTTYVMITITHTRADSAYGSSHTINAISQPAKIPRTSVVANGCAIASAPSVARLGWSSEGSAVVCASANANSAAPARFAASTTVQ